MRGRRRNYTTRQDPLGIPAPDLVERNFIATAPNRLHSPECMEGLFSYPQFTVTAFSEVGLPYGPAVGASEIPRAEEQRSAPGVACLLLLALPLQGVCHIQQLVYLHLEIVYVLLDVVDLLLHVLLASLDLLV
jgi:hypothetical protein